MATKYDEAFQGNSDRIFQAWLQRGELKKIYEAIYSIAIKKIKLVSLEGGPMDTAHHCDFLVQIITADGLKIKDYLSLRVRDIAKGRHGYFNDLTIKTYNQASGKQIPNELFGSAASTFLYLWADGDLVDCIAVDFSRLRRMYPAIHGQIKTRTNYKNQQYICITPKQLDELDCVFYIRQDEVKTRGEK